MEHEINGCKIIIFRTWCSGCDKFLNLCNKEIKNSSFCDYNSYEKWYCTDCFEYMDWSILYDDEIKPKVKKKCKVCTNYFYEDSLDYYKECRDYPELHNYQSVCTKYCLKDFIYDKLSKENSFKKINLINESDESDESEEKLKIRIKRKCGVKYL